MEGMLYIIEQKIDSFSDVNKKIAYFILKKPEEIVWYSSKQLAVLAGVSQASVTRFCRLCEFDSFAQLKILLSQEVVKYNDNSFYRLDSENFKENIAQNLLKQNIASLTDTAAILSNESVMEASNLLYKAKRIMCIGIGASDLVAQDMVHKLLRIQKDVFTYSDHDLRKIVLSDFKQDDLLIAVSYSGKKAAILEMAQIAKNHGVPIIAFSRVGKTQLSELANVTLEAAAFESEYRTSALSSRIAHLYLVDVLFYTYGLFFQEESMERLRYTYDVINKGN